MPHGPPRSTRRQRRKVSGHQKGVRCFEWSYKTVEVRRRWNYNNKQLRVHRHRQYFGDVSVEIFWIGTGEAIHPKGLDWKSRQHYKNDEMYPIHVGNIHGSFRSGKEKGRGNHRRYLKHSVHITATFVRICMGPSASLHCLASNSRTHSINMQKLSGSKSHVFFTIFRIGVTTNGFEVFFTRKGYAQKTGWRKRYACATDQTSEVVILFRTLYDFISSLYSYVRYYNIQNEKNMKHNGLLRRPSPVTANTERNKDVKIRCNQTPKLQLKNLSSHTLYFHSSRH